MMSRIRNNRHRGTVVFLVLAAGLFFSGLGFCLNHGHFCRDLFQHSGINEVPEYHCHPISAECSEHEGSDHHCRSDHHPEYQRHIHRKGEQALAGRQRTEQKPDAGVRPLISCLSVVLSNGSPAALPDGSFSYSTLFTIRSVVMLT